MNEIRTSCAPTDRQISSWESIDWNKCDLEVRKLQARIVKAQKEGRHGKVKSLQWLLTHSFAPSAFTEGEIDMHLIGHTLMGTGKYQYLLPFEAVSVLLLACIVGGLLIARKRK